MAQELITHEENITTADLLQRSGNGDGTLSKPITDDHEALFLSSDSEAFRRRWTEVQTGFVDEPKPSVEKADQLVAAVIQKLMQVFADERSKLERDWSEGGEASTEDCAKPCAAIGPSLTGFSRCNGDIVAGRTAIFARCPFTGRVSR